MRLTSHGLTCSVNVVLNVHETHVSCTFKNLKIPLQTKRIFAEFHNPCNDIEEKEIQTKI